MIECLHRGSPARRATVVLFDFDGTLSLLRAGWAKDWSRSRSSLLKINGFRGRPVRIQASSILRPNTAHASSLIAGRGD